MSASTDRAFDAGRRRTLPLVALLTTELAHIAATLANDGEPTAQHDGFGPPAHALSVLMTIGLLVWARRGRPHAHLLTAVAGGSVVAAALIYHVLPIDSGYLNPFSEGATTVQWITVWAGIAAGLWCVAAGVVGLRGDRPTLGRP
ncbi:MAG: hypothetical protein U0Q03_24650 [Acidimicrobiales bacterium]